MISIYTSSWFTSLPDTIQRIGVSRGTPRGQPAGYRMCKELAPGPWFKTAPLDEYMALYGAQLAALDARQTCAKLEDLSKGRDIALLCYEKPHIDEDWCHRGLIAAWLHSEIGIKVHEWGLEATGYGRAHPKIPREYRKSKP